MPYFKNDIVEKFIFTYEFDIIDDDLINIFLNIIIRIIYSVQN